MQNVCNSPLNFMNEYHDQAYTHLTTTQIKKTDITSTSKAPYFMCSFQPWQINSAPPFFLLIVASVLVTPERCPVLPGGQRVT